MNTWASYVQKTKSCVFFLVSITQIHISSDRKAPKVTRCPHQSPGQQNSLPSSFWIASKLISVSRNLTSIYRKPRSLMSHVTECQAWVRTTQQNLSSQPRDGILREFTRVSSRTFQKKNAENTCIQQHPTRMKALLEDVRPSPLAPELDTNSGHRPDFQ